MHVRVRTAYKPSEFKYRTPVGPIVKNVVTYTFYDAYNVPNIRRQRTGK